MDNKELLGKIIDIVKDVTEKDDISPEANLLDTESLDSMGIATVITKIEEAYNIELDVEDITMENFLTVNAIVSLVEKYL